MSVGAVEKVSSPSATNDVVSQKETKDYYAWTSVRFGADIDEASGVIVNHHQVEYGDKVTQKDLGLTDDEWNKLVEEKVIRKSVPPKTRTFESPKRALIAAANKQMEIALAGGE